MSEGTAVTKKDLRKVFWRSFTLQASESYAHMQALGYAYCMVPILKKVYKDDPAKYSEALLRHTAFFNTTPHVAPFVMGITASMEEQNAKNDNFDVSGISAIKAALMGPIAGIGDSFYWGTFRVIAAGIGIQFAMKGNVLGPILYFLIYTILHFLGRYYTTTLGYKVGVSFLEEASSNNTFEKFTMAASIIGLMSIGAMTAGLINFNIPLKFKTEGGEIVIQEILDGIFPGLLPLALTFFIFYLLKKQVKVLYIILGVFLFSIIGVYAGLL
jgi:mannose/fructose/sorbose-specific phosphotransferase system IID component